MKHHRFIYPFKLLGPLLIILVLRASCLYAQGVQDTSAFSPDYDRAAWMIYPIDDVGDVIALMPGYQLFDFLDYGQPRYVAPLNMLPHQAQVYRGPWLQNDRLNGMYNTRLLSIDMLDRVERLTRPSLNRVDGLGSGLHFRDINAITNEPFSRLRYWEGDFGSFDLSLLLAERLTPKIDLYLAGFNRGYEGFWPNSTYTGVKYDGRLVFYADTDHALVFSYGLNRQKNGMQNIGTYPDYNRSNYRDFVGLEYRTQTDTSQYFSMGLRHTYVRRTVRSTIDSFFIAHRYNQWQFYLQKNVQTTGQKAGFRLQIDPVFVWGTAYTSKKMLTRFTLYGQYTYKWSEGVHFANDASIGQENNFKKVFNLNSRLVFTGQKGVTGRLGFSFKQRNPDAAERYFTGFGFSGNSVLLPESVADIYFNYEKNLAGGLLLNARFGHKSVTNEILLNGNGFMNGKQRAWAYGQAGAVWSFWKFRLHGLGYLLSAKDYLAPRASATALLSFHDVWLKGAMVIDLSALARWNDRSDKIFYNPLVERFYWSGKLREAYTQYRFKAVVTVDDARLYFMLENPFIENYHIIEGYNAYARRVRFGVNWDFWN